jgi:hypothetical protein
MNKDEEPRWHAISSRPSETRTSKVVNPAPPAAAIGAIDREKEHIARLSKLLTNSYESCLAN